MPLPTDDKPQTPTSPAGGVAEPERPKSAPPKIVTLDPDTTRLLSNIYAGQQDLSVRVDAMTAQFQGLASTVVENGRRIGRLEKEIFPTNAPPPLPPLPPVDGATILSVPPIPGPPTLQKRQTLNEQDINALRAELATFRGEIKTELSAQSKVMGVSTPDKPRAFYRSRDFKKIVISLTVLAGTLYQVADRFVHPPPAPVVLPAPAATR